jgi:hypothetical protein
MTGTTSSAACTSAPEICSGVARTTPLATSSASSLTTSAPEAAFEHPDHGGGMIPRPPGRWATTPRPLREQRLHHDLQPRDVAGRRGLDRARDTAAVDHLPADPDPPASSGIASRGSASIVAWSSIHTPSRLLPTAVAIWREGSSRGSRNARLALTGNHQERGRRHHARAENAEPRAADHHRHRPAVGPDDQEREAGWRGRRDLGIRCGCSRTIRSAPVAAVARTRQGPAA